MTRDSKLIELSCKEFLMDVVKESKILDKKLSFFQKALMYDKIREMKYEDIISLIAFDGKKITTEQKKEFESKTKKIAKYGAAGLGGAYILKRTGSVKKLPGKLWKAGKWMMKSPSEMKTGRLQRGAARTSIRGALGAIAGVYLFRKLSDPCVRKNLGNKNAQIECKMEAIKKVISTIKADIGKCSGADDPVKCKKKLNKELIKWQTKYSKLLVQRNQSKRK